MAQVRRKTLEDGRIMVVREDGSSYIVDPMTGVRQDVSGPNSDLATAFGTNDTSELDRQIEAITSWQNSPAGQRANQLREQAYDEDVRRYDQGYGLQRDQFDLTRENQQQQYGLSRDRLGLDRELGRGNLEVSRQNADTSRYGAETGRYSAETGRMDTEARIAELERRFGLDVAQFGNEYLKTAIAYKKTPRSWVDAAQYEAGAVPIFQSIAGGANAPAFGAKGTTAPQMNDAGSTLSALGIGSGTGAVNDAMKSINQIIKAVPPGQSPQGQLSPTEIAAINLATELYKAGGANAPEGYWEGLDQDTQDTLLGAMDSIAPNGGDRYLRQYSRTRIPGRVGNPNAA